MFKAQFIKNVTLSRQTKVTALREKTAVNNTVVIVAASFLIGVAVQMLVKSGFGLGAYDAFAIGVKNVFNIPALSLTIWGTSGVLTLIAFTMGQKPKIYNALTLLVIGVSIEVAGLFIGEGNAVYSSVALFVSGFVLLSIGVSIFSYTKVGGGSIELIIFALNQKFNISVTVARWILDLGLLAGAFTLQGPIGFGTLFLAFATAPMSQVFSKHLLYISAGKAALAGYEKESYEELDGIIDALKTKV